MLCSGVLLSSPLGLSFLICPVVGMWPRLDPSLAPGYNCMPAKVDVPCLGFLVGEEGKTLAPGLLLAPVMFWAACPAPSPKITYKSKYCFLPFPVPDPFPPPATGYFLLLTVLTGVQFLRNKCPIQSNAWAGLDGVLGQSAVPGEELEGKEQVRAGGRQGRLRCGGHICWSFGKSPVSCPKRTPVLVSSKNGVTSVPPHQPSHSGVSLFLI